MATQFIQPNSYNVGTAGDDTHIGVFATGAFIDSSQGGNDSAQILYSDGVSAIFSWGNNSVAVVNSNNCVIMDGDGSSVFQNQGGGGNLFALGGGNDIAIDSGIGNVYAILPTDSGSKVLYSSSSPTIYLDASLTYTSTLDGSDTVVKAYFQNIEITNYRIPGLLPGQVNVIGNPLCSPPAVDTITDEYDFFGSTSTLDNTISPGHEVGVVDPPSVATPTYGQDVAVADPFAVMATPTIAAPVYGQDVATAQPPVGFF